MMHPHTTSEAAQQSPCSTLDSGIPARAQRFLRWLYENQTGYIEIVAGSANPQKSNKIDLVMHTRRWCYYDPERPDLLASAAAYVADLANDYGNVYCGVRLYTAEAKRTNTRAEKYTKPSRTIFIDDAPAAPLIPYTASIRTSEYSRHGYYKCDKHTTKDDARRIAAALGGDPSGVDLTQLVRIPGTFNTKRGQHWPVAVESGNQQRYTLDHLRAQFPEVKQKSGGKGEITDLVWPAVETHLSNIAALLASARAKLIRPDTQTGRILAGEMLSFPVRDRRDDSRTMNAYVLGNGFYIRGFLDEEIAAVVMHHYQKWNVERDKGTAWCKTDIANRILPRIHSERPDIKQEATRYTAAAPAQPLAEQPAASRARTDRPRQLDPLMLFNRYQQQPALRELSRKPRAQHLQISTATLDRLDGALREMGLIDIETLPKRTGSRVLLLGGVINIGCYQGSEPQIVEYRIETPQTVEINPQCIVGETHAAPETPGLAAAPATPALVDFAAPDDDSPLDEAEIDRLVAQVQAAQVALEKHRATPLTPHFVLAVNASERHEPQTYWQPHEIRAWHETHPAAPATPAAEQRRLAKDDRAKQRTRAKWDAMTPGQLARERAILRNFIKSHPGTLWPQWQLRELNERLASFTPDTVGVSAGVCPPQTTPDMQPTPEKIQQRLVACEPVHYEQPSDGGIVVRLHALKAQREAQKVTLQQQVIV